jgi:hypothetical protein
LEQELWKESQTRKAEISHKKKGKTEEKEHNLVFDNQIDYVMQETAKGYGKKCCVTDDKEEKKILESPKSYS